MSYNRQSLIEAIAKDIISLSANRILRVAIDGVDGSGKTTFADELKPFVKNLGGNTIRASVDGFHNPRDIRYARGRTSPEGFFYDSYNYGGLQNALLKPLGAKGSGIYQTAIFDHRSDAVVDVPRQQASTGSILILDGIFLHRDELRDHWDFSVFLNVDFEISIPRCAQRGDGSPDPYAPQNRRYVEGQKLYLSTCQPHHHATLVIDNNELSFPKVLNAESKDSRIAETIKVSRRSPLG